MISESANPDVPCGRLTVTAGETRALLPTATSAAERLGHFLVRIGLWSDALGGALFEASVVNADLNGAEEVDLAGRRPIPSRALRRIARRGGRRGVRLVARGRGHRGVTLGKLGDLRFQAFESISVLQRGARAGSFHARQHVAMRTPT